MTAEELLRRAYAAAQALGPLAWAEVNLGANLCLEHVQELARIAGVQTRRHVYATIGLHAPGVIEVFKLELPGPVVISAASVPRPATEEELTALGSEKSTTLDYLFNHNSPQPLTKP